ncbi:MAG TPA: efflux RND transporter periplasmic adaptor subunit [Burkholderiaceae bacterium]|nr:efflux RND transporter periplasmic adaptor subunit [Burkholderiaceae bacterium]
MTALYGVGYIVLGPKLAVYPVSRSELVQSIVASGRVETPLRINVGSQITGTVASIPVAEGQAVQPGQLLIILDDTEAKAAVEQARAMVAQAHARLRQIREVGLPAAQQALRQAEVNLKNIRRQYERTRQLQSQGFVGQSQLDDTLRNLEVAESQLRAAQLQVATNGAQGSDYLLAETALAQAQANLGMTLARLDYTTIEAPVDGTLIARNVERGDVVQPGKVLMVLSPAGQIQLVVQIDEKNLALLHLGQKALGSADAYPDQRFAAELAYINPAVDPQRGSVEVKFNVPNAPAYLRQDMTVSVDIEVASRANAVVVPNETVHDGSGSSPWVMKISDGRAKRQPVKLGVRGAGLVEIVAGLQPGDQVISATAGNVSEGQRVRTRPANSKKR